MKKTIYKEDGLWSSNILSFLDSLFFIASMLYIMYKLNILFILFVYE